jgi:hypothetical protein
MSPEEIKLNYFFDQPNYRFKIESEYLEYSEVDDCYSELTADVAIQNKDIPQNEAHQILQIHGNQFGIKENDKVSKQPKLINKLRVIKPNNSIFDLNFYGLGSDGDLY